MPKNPLGGRGPNVMLPSLEVKDISEPLPYHDHPYEAKMWARYAWWEGNMSLAKIAEAIEVNQLTVQAWVNGNRTHEGWAKEKERIERDVVKRRLKSNRDRIDYVLSKVLTVLETTVDRVVNHREELGVSEFNQFVGSFERIFKLKQLEMGAPTEIFKTEDGKSLTWDAIRKEIQSVDILDYSSENYSVENVESK